MSSAVPAELSAPTVISLIEAGAYPREVVLTVARGFLPLPQEDLIAVLAYLSDSSDEDVASVARTSLSDVPSRILLAFASGEESDAVHLERLARATTDTVILEALIRNKNVSDEAVVEMAARAEGALQEVIVINQSRILRAPEILDALLANEKLTQDARRRALEVREEFFDKKARFQGVEDDAVEEGGEEPSLIHAKLDAIADLLEKAAGVTETDTLPELAPVELKDVKKKAIWQRITSMTVSEKVMLAFKGDKMVRMLLVRDRNKLVCSAVMRNSRMSETEADSIASMRNVDDEVLRLLSRRRDWMSKYPIIVTLCHNPKAPIGVVLPLINRLTLRDLKNLKDDKGVTEAVRGMAKRFYIARTQKK